MFTPMPDHSTHRTRVGKAGEAARVPTGSDLGQYEQV
jgi:hypothetical protein